MQVSRATVRATIRSARWMQYPLLAFVLTRLLLTVVGYIAEVGIPGPNNPDLWHSAPEFIFLDIWARADSGWYMDIASHGYSHIPGQQSSTAFFPLYPLLIAALEPLFKPVVAGVIISNLAFLAGLLLLYRLTLDEFGEEGTARRTVLYLLLFPTAFFFSAVYTESLFFLWTVGAMYSARKRLWAWAALAGVLATATRIPGVLIMGAVGLEWLRAHGWTLATITRSESWRGLWQGLRRDGLNLLLILLIPLGMVSYMIYLYTHFGDPLAFSSAHTAWGREMIGPHGFLVAAWRNMQHWQLGPGNIYVPLVFDLSAILLVFALTPAIWRQLGESYALYSLLSMWLPGFTSTQSASRIVITLFPLFMVLGKWGERDRVHQILLIVFSVFLGLVFSFFVNWVFVA